MSEVLRTAALKLQNESSNKGYLTQVVQEGNTIILRTAWGALGKSFQVGSKQFDDKEHAEAAWAKVVTEKRLKGYVQCSVTDLGYEEEGETHESLPYVEVKPSEWAPMLLTPITKERAQELVADPDYFCQQKVDGTRLLLRGDEDGPRGYNRKGQRIPLPSSLVQAASTIFALYGSFALDGELVGTIFHAFDEVSDVSLFALERVFQTAYIVENENKTPISEHIVLVPTVISHEGKARMFAQAEEEGWEGLVFKHMDKPYVGGRHPENMKWKRTHTLTVLLTGINPGKKRELGSARMVYLLSEGRHKEIGSVASGLRAFDLEHIQKVTQERDTEAEVLFAEIEYLYFDQTSLVQPVFLGFRNDVASSDLLSQPIYRKDGTVGPLSASEETK